MATELETTLLKLETELDLNPEKFKTKHTKAIQDAIAQTQHLINQYKYAQQEFSKIPKIDKSLAAIEVVRKGGNIQGFKYAKH